MLSLLDVPRIISEVGSPFFIQNAGRTIQGCGGGFFVLGELKLLERVAAHRGDSQHGGNLDCEMILL
jgi:hypothetical protein